MRVSSVIEQTEKGEGIKLLRRQEQGQVKICRLRLEDRGTKYGVVERVEGL